MDTKQLQAEVEKRIEERAADELSRVDLEARYCDMLDDCYSFASVGGIFANMSPSRVLRECDPVAYRCGMVDYEDAEGLVEIGGEYYEADDVEKLRDDIEAEIEAENEDAENED